MFISFSTRKTGMSATVHVRVLCVAKGGRADFFWTRELKCVRLYNITQVATHKFCTFQ